MSKSDIGPPNFREMLPEVIEKNYGKWKYHEILKPGVLRHVSETGDEVFTVRAGSPRLVSIDFIRDCRHEIVMTSICFRLLWISSIPVRQSAGRIRKEKVF